ncbi:MAG: hypothetical protein ACYCYL_10175 [Acidithiobacillus sp.]
MAQVNMVELAGPHTDWVAEVALLLQTGMAVVVVAAVAVAVMVVAAAVAVVV